MLPGSSAACQLTTFFIGVTEVCFMSAPVGHCSYCCPRDDSLDIQYKLFTRASPTAFEIITVGDAASLRRTRFNASNPTVIYLMGFTEATSGRSTTSLRDAYLSAGDYNFVSVDWARLVAFPWYISAVRNTRYMGQQLASFVQFLDGAGARAASLHVVGFSLGAEAAGFGGKELRRRGLLLGRITGLDPAYPGYGLTGSDGHLAKGDAAFVDVLHTNPGVFGFPQPIGDVDFYPNAGQWVQPGCWVDQLIRNRELGFIRRSERRIKYCVCLNDPKVMGTLEFWTPELKQWMQPQPILAPLCGVNSEPSRVPCDFVSGMEGSKKAVQLSSRRLYGFWSWTTVSNKREKTSRRSRLSGKMYLETNQRPPFARNGP